MDLANALVYIAVIVVVAILIIVLLRVLLGVIFIAPAAIEEMNISHFILQVSQLPK